MPSTKDTPPYFHGLAGFACKRNRLYRVYVRPDELIFIWAGDPVQTAESARAAGVHHGVLGVLIASLIAKAVDSTKKNAARKETLDSTPLEDLVRDDKRNIRALIREFDEVKIGPRSPRHATMWGDQSHQAVLILRHRTLGKYRIGLASVEDVRVAVAELPRVFGSICDIGIEWSDREQKFVKKTI